MKTPHSAIPSRLLSTALPSRDDKALVFDLKSMPDSRIKCFALKPLGQEAIVFAA